MASQSYQRPHSESEDTSGASRDGSPLLGRIPLGQAINGATRSTHSKLNQFIIARLPLTIPPRADSASAYVSGLLYITPIYMVFETAWKKLLQAPTQPSDMSAFGSEFHGLETKYFMGAPVLSQLGPNCQLRRLQVILKNLWLDDLERTGRLKSDIRAMTGWSVETLEEQLRSISETGHLSAFLTHARHSIEKRPIVIIAYAWVFYLALFSGGRVIRASLESAGEGFWSTVPSPIRPNLVPCQPQAAGDNDETDTEPTYASDECHHGRGRAASAPHVRHARRYPLAFFHFNTPRDGEDLKAEFKSRLAAAADRMPSANGLDAERGGSNSGDTVKQQLRLLSTQERDQIVHEACCIFDNLLLVVGQLDAVCGTKLADASSSEGLALLMGKAGGGRFRDSIAISKERACRAAMQREVDADGGGDEGQDRDDSAQSAESSASSSRGSPSGCVRHVRKMVNEIEDTVARRREAPADDPPSGHVRWEAEKPTRDSSPDRRPRTPGNVDGPPEDAVLAEAPQKGWKLRGLRANNILLFLVAVALASFLRLLRLRSSLQEGREPSVLQRAIEESLD